MSDPPRDRIEFWIRFVCAFVFFGAILAFLSLLFVDDFGVAPVVVAGVVGDLLIAWYAARHGDSAWVTIMEMLRALSWWR